MSVIAELKRRNVFRVAALYLVAAWVLLQVGDLLFGLLGLPTWTNKLLFAALVLGFVPALIFSWVYELTPEGLKREKARASAQKALDLNPDLARAHLALGFIQHQYDWDWLAANGSYRRAMALDPGDADVLAVAATMAQTLGKLGAAIEFGKQAASRDPVAAFPRSQLALSYLYAGQLDEAEVEARTTLELSPELSYGRWLLSIVLLLKGESEAALEILKQSSGVWRIVGLPFAYHAVGQKEASDAALRELIEKFSDISAYQVAEAHAFRGEKEKAFAWLDRAYRQRDPGLTMLYVDPLFETIKSDPRFSAMLRKLKLPELRPN